MFWIILLCIIGVLLIGAPALALLAGLAVAIWYALVAAFYIAWALLGAIIFPIWYLIDKDAAMKAWRAGREKRT